MVHKYVFNMVSALKKMNGQKLIHHTIATQDRVNITNSAFLVGSFMIIELKKKPGEVMQILKPYASLFRPYRDACKGPCSYDCFLEHCFEGL
jgi:hypothetical protein